MEFSSNILTTIIEIWQARRPFTQLPTYYSGDWDPIVANEMLMKAFR